MPASSQSNSKALVFALLIVTIRCLSCYSAEPSSPQKQEVAPPRKVQSHHGNAAAEVAEVKPSHKHGFYDQPFQLALASKTDGAQIRYTTDGSEPATNHGAIYNTPVRISQTTVLRTKAFRAGQSPSRTRTFTFLFPRDIVRQSPDGLPPEGFPYLWGKNQVDYGMDPRIVDDPRFKDEILAGLRSLPSISLVSDMDNFFGEKRGVYSNPGEQGRESERPCSVELIHPDGRKGFQIDCGIRIRGGFSRMPINPKHAFRLFFREDYGVPKLKYPLFGAGGAQEFDNLDLRTFQNYSWSLAGDHRALFVRDQFNRDLQLAMNHPAARGEFCHLYINGHYWGLYNTCERPEASYGASYMGGRKTDYDVVKVDSGFTTRESTYTVIPTDGDLKAWNRLYARAAAGLKSNADYFAIQGRSPDGSTNPSLECLLDVDNLIDYMLIIFWGGNLDAPISAFGGNRNPNNFHSMRRRNSNQGFQFFIWDAEHTLLNLEEDRTGPFKTGEKVETSSPQWLWQQCVENAEFRLRVADLVNKRFSDGGILSPSSLIERFRSRTRQIESAVIAESARWGDVKHTFAMGVPPRTSKDGKTLEGPFNRDDDWRTEVHRLIHDYLPRRSEIVLGQLFAQGLLPDLKPPLISTRSQTNEGLSLILESTDRETVTYYTVDGSDPRLPGGSVSPRALRYSGPFTVPARQGNIRARSFKDGDWSAVATRN